MARLMTYLIAYDITDDNTRARAAAAIQSFGDRIQHSVYLADLEPGTDVPELVTYITEITNPRTDTIRISPQCAACLNGTITIGQAQRVPAPLAWIIV